MPFLLLYNFTFHNVSINTVKALGITKALQITLHSTMFLLIQRNDERTGVYKTPLHSTMFLLIRRERFHPGKNPDSLHSTMFLLIRLITYLTIIYLYALHSTMFLLIRYITRYYLQLGELYIPQCFY